MTVQNFGRLCLGALYMEHLFGLASECRCYINRRYKTIVSTLQCALQNGADLYVNERE